LSSRGAALTEAVALSRCGAHEAVFQEGGDPVHEGADAGGEVAAEDIGSAIALLLSKDAHWINGQRIEAAGGIHLVSTP